LAIEAARLKLANAILAEVAANNHEDFDALRNAALQALALSYPKAGRARRCLRAIWALAVEGQGHSVLAVPAAQSNHAAAVLGRTTTPNCAIEPHPMQPRSHDQTNNGAAAPPYLDYAFQAYCATRPPPYPIGNKDCLRNVRSCDLRFVPRPRSTTLRGSNERRSGLTKQAL
jgi:hypothetical protein